MGASGHRRREEGRTEVRDIQADVRQFMAALLKDQGWEG